MKIIQMFEEFYNIYICFFICILNIYKKGSFEYNFSMYCLPSAISIKFFNQFQKRYQILPVKSEIITL